MSAGERDPGAEAGAEVPTGPSRRRSRPLDEDVLDEIGLRIAELPEPVAAVATGVEVARAEGDATGVRKRLFELGVAVVRYAVSVALAQLAERLGDRQAPRPVAQALGKAARLSDGAWCALGRTVASHVVAKGGKPPPAFEVLRGKALAQLVQSRNEFVHGGGAGDDAPEQTLAVLDQAEPLLRWPLRVVLGLDPPSYQERMGVPLRAGVWRKVRKPVPEAVVEGGVYLVHDVGGEPRWTRVDPWLPLSEGKLLLCDSPHGAGSAWRWFDAETGEHRDAPELDRAVRGLAGQDSAAPVPPCDRPDLVGRQQAIGVMRRAAELSRAGAVGVVVLTGPQGVGRGRLLETMREAAASFGFGAVLEASCLEHRRGVLRPLRRATATVDGLDGVRDALARAAAGDALGGAAGLEAAVEAVEEALVEASLTEPLLLLVDDAQWADESTLTLLSLLTERATRKARGQVLVVATVRQEPRPKPALTALIGQVERDVGPGATRLDVGPLDTTEALRLLRGVAPLAKPLEQALIEGAAGVPFFLVQSVLAWDETGALQWRDGAWHPVDEAVLSSPVPGLADVVEARLVSYFEPGTTAERVARQLLCALGLAGGPLGLTALEATLGALSVTLETVESALEALVEAGLLLAERQPPEYRFAQPLVRQAVLDSHRSKPWLPRLHRALLEVMGQGEEADEDAWFIAEGYASLGDVEQAVTWLDRAVDHGITMGLFRQAVEHADRLAELAASPADRADAQLSAVEALLRAGEAQEARKRLGAVDDGALEQGGATLRLRARIAAVRIAHALGEAVERDDEGLVADADRVGDPRLGSEARLALAAAWRGARGLALARETTARLGDEQHGDLRYRAWVLRLELLTETGLMDEPECREAFERAGEAARALGSKWALLDAQNDRALLLSASGDQPSAIALLREVVAEAKQLGFARMARAAAVNVATCLWRDGQLEAAEGAARGAAQAAEHAADWQLAGVAHSVRADALRRRGRLEDARAAIDRAVTIKRRAGDSNVAIALLRQADILAECDDSAAACEAATDAQRSAEAAGSYDHAARARLWLAVHRYDREGEPAAAVLRAIVAELAARQEQLRGPTCALLAAAEERLRETR